MLSSWTCITSVKNLRVSRISFKQVKITLLQKLLADEEMNFLFENNLSKDLKNNRSVAVSFAAKPWFTMSLFLITQWITGPCEGLHSSKLNSANRYKIQKTAHKGICFARLRQIQLQQLFTGIVNCFEVTAGSCRSLLHSEWKGNFAYRNLFLVKNRNFHSALVNKTM